MNISDFKSGIYTKQKGYKSFSPSVVNHRWVITDDKLHHLLSEADRKLGELNTFSTLIPDIDFFIRMHIAKEATQSSRIEGTQTSIDEALFPADYIVPENRDDWQEVQNYIVAMNFAISQLDKLPLSGRLLKQTHKKLMYGVRGKHKMPGEFRTSQNWIGGASLSDAVFIPPHHSQVPELMGDLEKFLHNEDLKIPHLVRIAIAHYQFETIHPFLDGNGRLGRLLITLYLVSNRLLERPSLYLSDFLERNRSLYYDNLVAAREKNNLSQWILFFITGILETAQNSIDVFQSITRLCHKLEKDKITRMGKRAALAQKLLNHLFSQPVADVQDVAKELDVHISTAHRLINDFEKLKILKEHTGYSRNRIYVFEEYLVLFRK